MAFSSSLADKMPGTAAPRELGRREEEELLPWDGVRIAFWRLESKEDKEEAD